MYVNDVIVGKFMFIYGSLEIFIDIIKWREMFWYFLFVRKLGLIVVDEVYIIL